MNATTNIQAAAAALRTAETKLETARRATATHSANMAACERRLAELEKRQAAHLVAVALGEIAAAPVPDAAEIQGLRDQAGPNAEASAIFQARVTNAERTATAAREVYLKAARAHLVAVEAPPLRQRLADTLERLGADIAALMGLEDALLNDFANSGSYGVSSTDMERFVRDFADLSFWRIGNKDLHPSWIGGHGFRPYDIPGSKEARVAARRAVEEASA